MKRLVVAVFLLLFICTITSHAQQVAKVNRPTNIPSFVGYVPDELVLKFKENAGALRAQRTAQGTIALGVADFDAISERFAVSNMRKQFEMAESGSLSRYVVVKINNGTLDEALDAFRSHPMVEKVEPIGIHTVYASPNDVWFSDQWHLDQISDHDVDAQDAWDHETGNTNIIVGVLDTGVRYYHKDLGGANGSAATPTNIDGNMWINWAEKNGTAGVDDDGNGYVDDWVGWDWVTATASCWSGEDCSTPDNDPRDFNGHGTHCAGNVSALNNNNYGTCASAGGWGNGTLQTSGNGVKVMALRIGWSAPYFGIYEVGYVRMDFAASAFYYAARNGAKIASCSWGSSNSGGIAEAVDTFLARGGVIFKAAGNDGTQTADYLCGRTDIVSVAATDSNDCKADFSTYGTWVDISAPGTGIISAYHDHNNPANDYVAALDGTSMATPLAASVAALIWSQNPGWTAQQVKDQLYASADPIDALSCNSAYAGKLGAGRVNAYNAVNSGTPCDVVADFSGSPTSGCSPLTVNFTDLSTGPVTSWSWDFGDGNTSTVQNPSHQFTAAGTYTVSLTATSAACSNVATKTSYITVSAPVVANFTGAPISGSAPLMVAFTDQSTGNPTSWSWDFGDGGTSTLQNPSHQYSTPGVYTVSLTAGSACGSDLFTRTNYITVTEPSTEVISYATSDIPVAGSVSGSYLSTQDSDTSREVITEIESGGKPSNRYSYLEHKWSFNVTAGTTMTFYLEAYRPNNTDGDNFVFSYSTDNVSFTNLVTVANATEQLYSVPMPASLSGTVYIRVIDTDRSTGNRTLDAVYIDQMYIRTSTVPGPPVAAFVGSPRSGTAPLTVQFTDQSTGSPTSWSWDFGDGGTSTAQSPSHQYTTPGTYTVSLTAANTHGSNVETKTGYITVADPSMLVHVSNVVVTRAQPKKWEGRATVTVLDAANSPVAGALVTGFFNYPNTTPVSATTGANGQAVLVSASSPRAPAEYCFEVTSVSASGYSYDAGSNVVTRACESGPVFGNEGITALASVPGSLELAQNHPNPFNPSTSISFSLPHSAEVTVEVFNILGARIRTLASGTYGAGAHTVEWNSTNDQGETVASGIYFYRLTAGSEVLTKKMLLMK